jgi:hypothetical protein
LEAMLVCSTFVQNIATMRKLFNWLFKKEIADLHAKWTEVNTVAGHVRLQYREMRKMYDTLDISVDVHDPSYTKARSWAVLSLQGDKSTMVKFVDLGDNDIHEIAAFLRKFEKDRGIKVDASPSATGFLHAYLK